MNTHQLLAAREYIREALEKAGAEITGSGMGFGGADLDVEVNGVPFILTIKPMADEQAEERRA